MASAEKYMEDPVLDSEMMLKIARTRMPFGKYKGRFLLVFPKGLSRGRVGPDVEYCV